MNGRPFFRLCTIIVLLGVGLVGCFQSSLRDPFQVRPDAFRSGIGTIAIAPLRVSPEVVSPALARDRFESLAQAQLEATGRTVLPSSRYASLWNEIAASIGEIADPKTGEIDEERWDMVSEAVRGELRRNDQADAVLLLQIVDVQIERPKDPVEFCGSTRRAFFEGPDGPVSLMRKWIVSARGTCLIARLYDIDGRELYTEFHGIEIVEVRVDRTRSFRPLDRRLTSRIGVEVAVESVLTPLIDGLGRATP